MEESREGTYRITGFADSIKRKTVNWRGKGEARIGGSCHVVNDLLATYVSLRQWNPRHSACSFAGKLFPPPFHYRATVYRAYLRPCVSNLFVFVPASRASTMFLSSSL